MKTEIRDKMEYLFFLSLEGEADDEQMALLLEIIKTEPIAKEYYVDLISIDNCLRYEWNDWINT